MIITHPNRDKAVVQATRATVVLLLLASAALVLIVTAHPDVDYRAVVAGSSLVFDARGVTRGFDAPNVVRL